MYSKAPIVEAHRPTDEFRGTANWDEGQSMPSSGSCSFVRIVLTSPRVAPLLGEIGTVHLCSQILMQ